MEISAKINAINTGLRHGDECTVKEVLLKDGFLYMGLFHGRRNPNQDLNGWGSEGPVVGPFSKIIVEDFNKITLIGEDGTQYQLKVVEDLVYIDGTYYGDVTIFTKKRSEKLPSRSIDTFPVAQYPYNGILNDELTPAVYIDAQNTIDDSKVLHKRALIGPLYGMHTTYLYHIRVRSQNLSPDEWNDLNFSGTELVDGKFNRLEIFVKQ